MTGERRIGHLFSTIALDLADLDPEWKNTLWGIVADKRALRTTSSIQLQFKNFILEPAKSISTIGPLLIVIDAVDESGDKHSRAQLLQLIMAHVGTLPPNFRILITSRPEPDIEKHLGSSPLVLRKRMESVPSTARDIRRYIEAELASELDGDWQNGEWLDGLVNSAEGLFQWAFTACRFVKGDGEAVIDPVGQLDILLSQKSSTNQLGPLDSLYAEVLKRKFPAVDRVPFGAVMRIVLAARQPLSMGALKKLTTQLSADGYQHPFDLILRPLGSLLSGVAQTSSPISPLHTSFRDFLLDPSRSAEFYVDLSKVDDDFASSCFNVMQSSLRFNICDLETSHLANAEVPDLSSRVEQAIPQHLSYACRFWTDHLCASSLGPDLLDKMILFLKKQFLHWLEAMSLMGAIAAADSSLQNLEGFSPVSARIITNSFPYHCQQTMYADAADFVLDASRFVSAFSSPISQAAPHTYLSALPFAPAQSRISKHYLRQFGGTLSVVTGRVEFWPTILNILEGHSNEVLCIAFAPDGKRVVSGSQDHTVRIWDAQTGALVAGPFEGHSGWVRSVAFSSDGKRVISGSNDETVRIWDAQTGVVVAGPFQHEGNNQWVTSVAFSHDGRQFTSACGDKMVRVWDVQTGAVVAGPFTGHGGASLSFSHDGKRVVSGSRDRTIRIWDTQTGAFIAGPFEGHSDVVTSVALSHDSKRVASGSEDRTIRIWDAETGTLVAGPFDGHENSVKAVAFSQDGQRVVSGAGDGTVRIWSVQTGALVAGPFKGHSNLITSVAFSPDGKRIASGAFDKTVRIWDAQTSIVTVPGPVDGHRGAVRSVAFSQDGKWLASGSRDKTVRVWNAQTGAIAVGPLNGHSHLVRSIAFSHDSKYVASGSADNTVRIWDVQTGAIVAGPFEGHDGWIESLAFSHDGKRVTSSTGKGTVRIWDVQTGTLIAEPFRSQGRPLVTSTAVSQDGMQFAFGSGDRTLQIRKAESGAVIAGPVSGHDIWITSLAFYNDHRVASGAKDKTVRIWDAQTGVLVAGPCEGHGGPVTSVAYSPDGKLVASGFEDWTVRIWDAHTGALVARPCIGHGGPVRSIAFSHDSTRVASGSDDWTVRVWRVQRDDPVSAALGEYGVVEPFLGPKSPDDRMIPGQDKHHHHSSTHLHFIQDDTELQNGWVIGEQGELICWVPPIHRSALRRPSILLVIGATLTTLDATNFAHGERWSECWTGSDGET
jgi:WD40 repeat protein